MIILINLQLMILEYTLHHHVSGVNAIALSPEGDRLLSGGKSKPLTSRVAPTDDLTGDDADIVIWDILTGEKVQVISCAFHGPIGALAWIPGLPGLAPGFAFGCADGSIHVYQRLESSVCKHHLEFVNQSNVRY
jgi:WD40 repeat protein